jgi:hypothetical protein
MTCYPILCIDLDNIQKDVGPDESAIIEDQDENFVMAIIHNFVQHQSLLTAMDAIVKHNVKAHCNIRVCIVLSFPV